MEIKKGISQMAEYPNVEINYVMSRDGRMYYVLKDGILENGCIIATLDPKYAIDEKNLSTSVGVFNEAGEVLINFDKKSIKSISKQLVLVENTKLSTPEVVGIYGKESDPMISQSVNEAKEKIISQIKSQMTPSGEILFSNPYSEANVYSLDAYNNKIGIDCSYIGKDETGLFFHTNDINSQTQIIEVDDFKKEENISVENVEESTEPQALRLDIHSDILNGFQIPNEDLEKMKTQQDDSELEESVKEKIKDTSDQDNKINSNTNQNLEESFENEEDDENNEEDSTLSEISLQITNDEEKDMSKKEKEKKGMEKEKYKNRNSKRNNKQRKIDFDIEEDYDDYDDYEEDDEIEDDYQDRPKSRKNKEKMRNSEKSEVLDHAIEVINKMIKETNKLKRRISLLEEQLQEKDEIIQESESKKDELNEILDKANEVLQEIR